MSAAPEHVERNARILALRLEGLTLAAIGKAVGLSPQRVSDVLQAAKGGRRERVKAPPCSDDDIRRLHGTGLSATKLARTLGAPAAFVCGRIRAMGLEFNNDKAARAERTRESEAARAAGRAAWPKVDRRPLDVVTREAFPAGIPNPEISNPDCDRYGRRGDGRSASFGNTGAMCAEAS